MRERLECQLAKNPANASVFANPTADTLAYSRLTAGRVARREGDSFVVRGGALLACGSFQAGTIENSDTFATDANNSGSAQLTQSGGHGFTIDAQMLCDLLMR